MLGANNARINALEAENRKLRADLLAQTLRVEALAGIIAHLQRENEAAARQLANMATATQVATQQAQAGRGFVLGETAFERQCWN